MHGVDGAANRGAASSAWPFSRNRLLGALLVAALVPGCAREREPAAAPASAPRVPEQEIVDYRLIQSEEGSRRWTLNSERMRKYADQQDAELDAPRMDFFRDGVYYSTLTARRGRANLTSKNLFAQGEVVIVTADGKRLETEELHYDNRTGRITNTVFNRFTRGGDVMTGYGLDASPELDYFSLRRRVDAAVSDTTGGGAP